MHIYLATMMERQQTSALNDQKNNRRLMSFFVIPNDPEFTRFHEYIEDWQKHLTQEGKKNV